MDEPVPKPVSEPVEPMNYPLTEPVHDARKCGQRKLQAASGSH